jgi:hypothetical protein
MRPVPMIIVKLKDHFPERAIEWLLGFMLMAWGYVVVMVPDMFTTNPNFAAFKFLGPQSVWGLGSVAVGTCRLMLLFVNGAWRRSPHGRLIASFFSAFIWTQIAIGCILSPVANTGIVVYGGLTLADIYSAFRAGADAGRVDNKAKAENADTRNGRHSHG